MGLIAFGLVCIGLWLLLGPIIALVQARNAQRRAEEIADQFKGLQERIRLLENELRRTEQLVVPLPPAPVTTEEPAAWKPKTEPEKVLGPTLEANPVIVDWLSQREAKEPAPPLPVSRKLVDYGDTAEPAPIPQTPEEPKDTREPFSLEQFMGVKLFAWLGGVAMFFGVIFFVKYAFENNLIPPSVRIALGFVTGTGLLIGGLVCHRLERYRVLAQAFLATGVLILYGVSFAAHAIYHFPFFGTLTTFGLMGLITLVAFLLAVRLNALVVAVLGMLGGFLTPALLATGQDSVFGLFGYIALLDIGLLAVSRHSRWRFLVPAAALGTVLMQLNWYNQFFQIEHYFEGTKTLIPLGILLFFITLFLAGGWLGQRKLDRQVASSVLGLVGVAILFAGLMLSFEQVSVRYILLYGFLLLINFVVITVAVARPQFGVAQPIGALLTFLHLAAWTNGYLTETNLLGALAIYLVFGALHAVVPPILARRVPASSSTVPHKAGPWFGPLVLILMLMPVMSLSPVPLLIWVGILMANLLMILLAITTGAIIQVLVSLILTMFVAAMWLFQMPMDGDSLLPFLTVITGFAAMFAVAGKWFSRRNTNQDDTNPQLLSAAQLLPIASAVLPYSLLVLALSRLPVANPSPFFGVALLMTVLLAGLSIHEKKGSLLLLALVATQVVEREWDFHHFQATSPTIALSWYLGFYALFFVFPFVFRKAAAADNFPWITSALSGVGHFLLIYNLVKRAYPNSMMGLVPLAFAIPTLIGLIAIMRQFPTMDEKQRSRLAWFGGVALLFITLIFPIQFERQWITVSWAIEGALLLWLFRRVPHPGLQFTGLTLLAVSFIRLTFNPAVFSDYPRSGTPILNWHLYVYGLTAAAHLMGGYWFTDPTGRWKSIKPQGLLHACGGLLLFLLLNIEIADYFTTPGDRCIAFQFGGNFPRDMTYSIAWGLFSLGLLGVGFWKNLKYARFAAVLLLVITLLKVFLHDLAAIQNIFRIGALVGVAMIAFVASFLYQRFFDRSKVL